MELVLIWNAKRAGRVASPVQFIFWLLLAICQGFTFGSVINHDLAGLAWSPANEILVILSWILILLNFIAFCVPDKPPTYVDIKGNFCPAVIAKLARLSRFRPHLFPLT